MKARKLLRVLHLAAAGCLGTLVYSPWIDTQWFLLLNQFVVVPLLVVTGVWMWLGPRLRRASPRVRSIRSLFRRAPGRTRTQSAG